MNRSASEDRPVLRHVLKNGAKVLIKEDPTSSVVSFNIWVDAGSIDEKPEERGMAHLIEHMIFKGTHKRAVGEISRQVEALGGYLNAFTSFEHTCFYVVLPYEQIQKAMEIEFDAFLNSTFDARELEKEKEVVFEEMKMRRDDPWSWSWELLFKALFKKSPYRWPIIGDEEVLRKVPRQKLMDYYRKRYVPSKTVISVVGNVDAEKVFRRIRSHFERIKAPAPPSRQFSPETEPDHFRVLLVEGDIQQIYASLAFPTVAFLHEDAAAFEVLSSLLGDGASSRLNLELREKKQSADEIGADHFSGRYGGAFTFQCLTNSGRLGKALSHFMQVLEDIRSKGIPDEELAKVKTKITASKVFEKESADGQAKTLGYWELSGGIEKEPEFISRLQSVTSRQIQDLIGKYLSIDRGTLLIYHPKTQKITPAPESWRRLMTRSLQRPSLLSRSRDVKSSTIKRIRLSGGQTLLFKKRDSLPLVSLGVFYQGGFRSESKNEYGITSLMNKCLLKGTVQKDHAAFSAGVEGLAAHLDPMMEKDYWGMTLDCMKSQFAEAVDLMFESLQRSKFDPTEVQKEKKLQLSAIKRLKDDPAEFALLHSDLLTFVGTPYAHMPMGTLGTVENITPNSVRAWNRSFNNSGNPVFVAVGRIEESELISLLEAKMGAIKNKHQGTIPARNTGVPLESNVYRLKTENQQAHLVLGVQAPSFLHEDYYAFRVMNTLLNGMGGRLFVELREKRSLAYSVFGAYDAGSLAGIYQIYMGCGPSKTAEARGALEKILYDFCRQKVSHPDLGRAKTYMSGLYRLGFQSNRSQVMAYARHELAGKGALWADRLVEQVMTVTAEQVQTVAKKYLASPNKTWVLLEP